MRSIRGLLRPANAQDPTFDDSTWEDVGIPHTWNDVDTFINQQSGGGDGSMVGGTNWYRKHFTVDAQYSDRKILVEARKKLVWVKRLGRKTGKPHQRPKFYL